MSAITRTNQQDGKNNIGRNQSSYEEGPYEVPRPTILITLTQIYSCAT